MFGWEGSCGDSIDFVDTTDVGIEIFAGEFNFQVRELLRANPFFESFGQTVTDFAVQIVVAQGVERADQVVQVQGWRRLIREDVRERFADEFFTKPVREVRPDEFWSEAIEGVFTVKSAVSVMQSDVQGGECQGDRQIGDWLGEFHCRSEFFGKFFSDGFELGGEVQRVLISDESSRSGGDTFGENRDRFQSHFRG